MEKEAVICAVLVFVTACAGVSQNSEISCPSTFFKEGSSILHLTVVNSTFSVCDLGPTTVTCRWAPTNGLERIVCSSSVTRCERDVVSLRCPCVQESGQGFKYNFKFRMLPNQEQGLFYCDFDCTVLGGRHKATVDSSKQCSNITFVSKCFKNGQCERGTCRINENEDDFCDCTGTHYAGTSCEKLDPFVIALICVLNLLVVVMAAGGAGVYFARTQRSGGQQNAPRADAPPANAPLANAPQVNDPGYNTPPDNAPQVAGSAGPSTGETTPYDEPDESSVASSETSEGTEYSASEVSEV
ncbi:uncharacterized protein [Littorina saxatilis]|uniref:uncharacterized protein n=1 Tax=Littorina saxatilis TaxID=31220 RepID=UPI0038B4566E